MKIFFSNYHISVNNCFVDDLYAIGMQVVMPTIDFAKGRIGFFAPNDEHSKKHGVSLISYEQFMQSEPMAIVIPCNQMYEDFMRLYEERGKKDILVYLPALSTSIDVFPVDGADFVISHDLTVHRACHAKHKILYFNKPRILIDKKYSNEDIEELFEFINLFLNFKNEKYDKLFYEELEKMPKTKERESLNSYDKFLLKKGKNQEKNEIAVNMLKMGLDLKLVSQATGLTIAELDELKKNIKY